MTEFHGNPFINARLEYEANLPLYVLEGPDGFTDWITTQQYLFEGVRGSGKSAILRSMEYSVAWKLSKIEIEASEEVKNLVVSQPHHLGVRLRLETMDTSRWEAWRNKVGNLDAQNYFATYLEYCLVDLFLSALVEIMAKYPEYFQNMEAEHRLVKDIATLVFIDSDSIQAQLSESTIFILRDSLRQRHLTLRKLVYKGASIKEIQELFNPLSPGELVQCFGTCLTTQFTNLNNLLVFPMLDDCNHLADWQVSVINSAILKAQTPVSYKITSVQDLFPSKVTIDNRPLSEHELKTLNISGDLSKQKNRQWSKRFELLANGVCRSRIRPFIGNKVAADFDLERLLGESQLECELLKTLNASEKYTAHELVEKSIQTAGPGAIVSISRTWLSNVKLRTRNTFEASDVSGQKVLDKQWNSIYYKKWHISAAVAICKYFNKDFPYHGYNMVLHLSGGSIRDLLRLMYDIFAVQNLSADKFALQNNIPIDKQIQGIKQASTNYLNGLDKHALMPCNDVAIENEIDPTSLYSICLRLGSLFSKFQEYPFIKINPEIASISIKVAGCRPQVLDALNFGTLSGAFRVKKKAAILSLGLHPIMSPYFNNSYRKPFYYPQRISISSFYAFFSRDDKSANRVIINAPKEILDNFEKNSLKINKQKTAQISLI